MVRRSPTTFYTSALEPPRWRCRACGANAGELVCRACGTLGFHVPVKGNPSGDPIQAIAPAPPAAIVTGTGFDRITGPGLPRGSVGLLYAAPGAGKTTAALRAAAGTAPGTVINITSAEQPRHLVAAYARRLGLDRPGVFIRADSPGAPLRSSQPPPECDLLIVDSLQYMMDGRGRSDCAPSIDAALRFARRAASQGAAVIAISQVAGTGRPRGGAATPHAVQWIARISGDPERQLYIDLEKNQHGLRGRSPL